MTNRELNVYLAAVLSTLNSVDWAIESTLYIGLGSMDVWTCIKDILLAANLVTCDSSQVRLTAAGKIMADKVDAAASKITAAI